MWRHHSISRKAKLCIYNTSALSVFLDSQQGLVWQNWRLWYQSTVHNRGYNMAPQFPTYSCCPAASCIPFGSTALDALVWPHQKTQSYTHNSSLRPCRETSSTGRWIDVITRDLHQTDLSHVEAEPLALDQCKWRSLVNLIGSMHGTAATAEPKNRWW